MENISVAGEFGRKPALSFEGTPSDELVVEVLHAGDGQVVEAGDTITCHYYGAVFGSDVDFDNSFDRGGALSFQIGVGMVRIRWLHCTGCRRVSDGAVALEWCEGIHVALNQRDRGGSCD